MGWLVARTIVHPGFFPFPSSFLGTYNVDLNGSQTLTQRGDQAPFSGHLKRGVWELAHRGLSWVCLSWDPWASLPSLL